MIIGTVKTTELIQFFWEVFKTLAPALAAWWLATRSARKTAENNRLEMRAQLAISKQNSFTVQNKAYRLQFSIEQLETYAVEAETMLDEWNDTTFHFDLAYNKEKDYSSAIQARLILTEFTNITAKLKHRFGFLESIVLASNPAAYDECQKRMFRLRDTGEAVGPTLHLVQHLTDQLVDSRTVSGKQFNDVVKTLQKETNNQSKGFADYSEAMLSLRDFFLEEIDIIFKQLNKA